MLVEMEKRFVEWIKKEAKEEGTLGVLDLREAYATGTDHEREVIIDAMEATAKLLEGWAAEEKKKATIATQYRHTLHQAGPLAGAAGAYSAAALAVWKQAEAIRNRGRA